MEELKIGDRIILEVVEDKKQTCNGCFFNDVIGDIYGDSCKPLKCGSTERKDCKNVTFKLVED